MDSKYRGMTVNERLYLSGLLNEFDAAIKKSDVEKAIQILRQVELTNENIAPILESYGLKMK
jgi:iron uptake system EfeUOB component EfeO/EfeM